MKRILTICLAVVAATTMFAKDYQNSIGVVAGSGLGVQFKDMVTDHFTIIEEFGYLGSFAAAGDGFAFPTLGAIDNLVLAYQAQCAEGQGIRLDYYAGGQIKGGYMGGGAGMVGFGAAAGIEANMKNAPIAFSFDFRPGYGCLLMGGGAGVGVGHAFDWTLNLGVRYTF